MNANLRNITACRGRWEPAVFGKALAEPCVGCIHRAAAHVVIATRKLPEFTSDGKCPERKGVE